MTKLPCTALLSSVSLYKSSRSAVCLIFYLPWGLARYTDTPVGDDPLYNAPRGDVLPYLTVSTHPNSTDRWRVLSSKSVPVCISDPDFISIPEEQTRMYGFSTELNITCWTTPTAGVDTLHPAADNTNPISGRWYKTQDDCFIADYNLILPGERYLLEALKFCPRSLKQKAKLREQYGSSAYCYSCPALACPPTYIDTNQGNVELVCWSKGETVRGDEFWWKLKSSNCWMPNEQFDPTKFYGE
jgi:hypothetical protein